MEGLGVLGDDACEVWKGRRGRVCMPAAQACQRWKDRKASYRKIGEGFDPKGYRVRLVSEREAKAFVLAHHYAGTMPAARRCVGLFRAFGPLEILVGAAVFSVPAQGRAITAHLGVEPARGVELGRFVLAPEVEGNAESFFGARALAIIRDELRDVEGVLSYSDPLERQDEQGLLVKPGHIGVIYQALGADYRGLSAARWLLLDRRGAVLSERAVSKVRGEERGDGGAYEMMRRAGCGARLPMESGAAYVERAVREAVAAGVLRRMRHTGNHVYTFNLRGPHFDPLDPPLYPKRGGNVGRCDGRAAWLTRG